METLLRVQGLRFPLQLCDTQDEVSQTLAGGITNGLGEWTRWLTLPSFLRGPHFLVL